MTEPACVPLPPAIAVSAIIPNWNGAALLPTVLDSLANQSYKFSEVLVVDNGSSDDSAAIASARGARVIQLPANLGFSRAVNAGIAECAGEWIAIINNDVEAQPDWLANLLHGAAETGAGFATGKLLDASGTGALDGTFDEVCRGACAWRCGHGRMDGALWNQRREIRFAPFTASIFERRVFAQAGVLDEDYESYLEDVDFGIRCAILGVRGVYVPEAAACHRGSATLGRWHADTVRRIARNQLLLVAKHYPERWWRHNGWAVLVAQSLWGLVALRHGAAGAFLRGKLEGARAFGRCRRAGSPRLFEILRESENHLRELQQRSGFDPYWRAYFALT